MKAILFFLFFSLTSCAFISGIKEAKNTPPAPVEPVNNPNATNVAVPPPAQAPINTNTPNVKAAKSISPATF